jgi:transposase
MLDRIDRHTADIDDVSQQIEALLAPFEEQLAQIDSVTGFGRRSAQDLLAEIGVDMTRFRTGAHLVSWAGFCPQVKQSAGELIGRNARTKGNRYIGAVSGEASVAAGRTKSRAGARYRRLAKRRGAPKAQVASGNTQPKIIHHLPSNPGTHYEDLGPDYYETQMHHRRQVRNHVKSLERPGYTVTLDTVAEPPPTAQTDEEEAA